MLPYDPIFSFLLVVGVFTYYGLKSIGESINKINKKEKKSHEEFIKWLREKEIERSPENVRYQNWLYDHRQE
jgi:hypothetical protein